MDPRDRKYTKDHEWVKMEGDTVTEGLANYAQEHLSDIVFVELPEVGRQIKQGEAIGVVESVKAAADLYAGVSGEVVEVNEKLLDEPSLINKDPYGEAWIVKIRPAGTGDFDKLMGPEDYDKFAASDTSH
jgi:glycine cleavage system H protein